MPPSSRTKATSSAPSSRRSAREKTAALRREAELRERRRSRMQKSAMVGGAAAVVGAVVLIGVLSQPEEGGTENAAVLEAVSGLGAASAPPWPAPADVPARAEMAGLPLGPMGTAEHYHAHLDVLVDGEPVQVPANIGVDPASGSMSGLHTHSSDGLIHIEASRVGQTFTLGQLFTQWNVRLTDDQIGSLEAGDDKSLAVYADGEKVTVDPAMVKLAPHQQITVVFGPSGQPVDIPSTYDFGPGE